MFFESVFCECFARVEHRHLSWGEKLVEGKSQLRGKVSLGEKSVEIDIQNDEELT